MNIGAVTQKGNSSTEERAVTRHFLAVFIYSLSSGWVNLIISYDLSCSAQVNLLDCQPRNGLPYAHHIGTQ